ncbi:putative tick transposon [Operophtera brumata]|uniref:Putative tick transposon n=1 Tax=Operophtera brumata TaxID=104452 RepID=A0A0L7LLW7_OPEBR|nr:putative tick transposon [Operophtera brumata]
MDDLSFVNKDIEQISVSESLIYSPENVYLRINNNSVGLKILHANIRSINCNFDHLTILLHRLNLSLDVIILSECWLSKSPFIPALPDFNVYESSHRNQNDGVVAYVKNGLNCDVEFPDFYDANCITLKFSNNLAIIALYRSPSHTNLTPFFQSLDTTLTTLKNLETVAIIGDININLLPNDKELSITDEYLNLVASHAMLPAHLHPTRKQNCLDHIILRTSNNASTFILDTPITDHLPLILCLSAKGKVDASKRVSQRNNIPAIISDLQSTDFSPILTSSDPDTVADALVNVISTIVKKHSCYVPIPSRKRIIKPWITPGLLKCIRQRDKLYRKFKKTPENEINKTIYLRYRKFCNGILKKVKREYQQVEIQKARKNPKATWNIIKQIANLHKKQNNSSNLLKLNDNPLTSINSVNTFFANVDSYEKFEYI